MTENSKYWIWLQMCLGEGALFKEIIDEFGSARGLYDSNIIEWKQAYSLTISQVERLQKYNLDEAQRVIEQCRQNDWKIVDYDDEAYPMLLKEISNPPAVLFVDGEIPSLDNRVTVSIVGTRKASTYAQKVTNIMSRGIAKCGAVVVSGGALGVDSEAHKGALAENGLTLAVLGCGLGCDYLQANKELREQIKKQGGALITEFMPFTKPTKFTFPLRNRIISGLSLGTLVVEAGEKSGSLITASYANEQGRDVYVIPASILDYNFLGTNKLIADGATVATSPSILIERYAERYDTIDLSKAKTAREIVEEQKQTVINAEATEQVTFDNIVKDRARAVKRQEMSFELKNDEKAIYNALTQEFVSIDEIAERAGLDTKQALVALTKLELKALIDSASGKRYRLK